MHAVIRKIQLFTPNIYTKLLLHVTGDAVWSSAGARTPTIQHPNRQRHYADRPTIVPCLGTGRTTGHGQRGLPTDRIGPTVAIDHFDDEFSAGNRFYKPHCCRLWLGWAVSDGEWWMARWNRLTGHGSLRTRWYGAVIWVDWTRSSSVCFFSVSFFLWPQAEVRALKRTVFLTLWRPLLLGPYMGTAVKYPVSDTLTLRPDHQSARMWKNKMSA